ncbi:hypothetical protein [Dyadobacter frigoris]|uniref:Uncharacterized protein n=1 Tax=Dyadobacter frigoris TaxID=2576211 RepID=A0A4U6D9B8_9BACT|nr:hypothetical protein [Dyadobacter frigoris]TKT90824.1 hypothetical protein FDK13_17815 [Dyadobacter frigoris]GLU52160.1 hypothetical protein Dfri01_16210 [Dyadobacter frigoris]
MKKFILFSVILFLNNSAFGQDSLKVTFLEVQDTLVKQHFIDRYENVFMTKVASRHIIKVGYATSLVRGSGLNIGYEYKVLPAFSLEAGGYFENVTNEQGISRGMFNRGGAENTILDELYVNAKARWYYNMKSRIESGLNANNFSGNYFAFSYEQSFIFKNRYPHPGRSQRRTGIQYGFQSRFLNNGFVDFSVGLFHRPTGSYEDYNFSDHKSKYQLSKFKIATQMNFGLGIGSWKKKSTLPSCEILVCDEDINDQWKLNFPYLYIGTSLQQAVTQIAYERKIGKSPFSITGDLNLIIYRNIDDFIGPYNYSFKGWNENGALTGGLQLRYYYLQKQQIRKGRGSANFSGPYFSVGSGYQKNYTEYHSPFHENNVQKGFGSNWTASLATGYQLRFLKKFFVDANAYYLRSLSRKYAVPIVGMDNKNSWNFKVGFGFVF